MARASRRREADISLGSGRALVQYGMSAARDKPRSGGEGVGVDVGDGVGDGGAELDAAEEFFFKLLDEVFEAGKVVFGVGEVRAWLTVWLEER